LRLKTLKAQFFHKRGRKRCKPGRDVAVGVADHDRDAGVATLAHGGVERWMGHRPSLPDSKPVIGRSPKVRNAYFAFGHGHVGLTGAPATAEIVAALVAGETPAIDPRPFAADRFG